MKKVTIVGAGVGGLCTGIRLLAKGYMVVIYEKNDTAGGVVTRITTKDRRFSWEESASIAINQREYEQIFIDVGRNPKDYFEWIPTTNSYKIFYEDQTSIKLPNQMDKLMKVMKTQFLEDYEGYKTFLYTTYKAYEKAKKHLLNRDYSKWYQKLNLRVFYEVYQLHTFTSAKTAIEKLIIHPKLREALLFQVFFMGKSPEDLPNIYTSIPEQSQVEGIWQIKGGLSAYKEGLLRLYEELGGKIYYNHQVVGIRRAKCKIIGISIRKTKLENQRSTIQSLPKKYFVRTYSCKKTYDRPRKTTEERKRNISDERYVQTEYLVMNTGYEYSLDKLLKLRKIRHYEPTCSVCVIHLGLDKIYHELEVHNLYVSDAFQEEIERVFEGKLPKNPSVYIYSPSKVDESYCKYSNESSLNIMVRVPHLDTPSEKILWNQVTKENIYDLILKQLKTIKGMEDLEKHILTKVITTPQTFQMRYNYTKGSCFGIAPTFFQSLIFRPQSQLNRYSNLYFVGSSIHPGNGVSVVMMGAKNLVYKL